MTVTAIQIGLDPPCPPRTTSVGGTRTLGRWRDDHPRRRCFGRRRGPDRAYRRRRPRPSGPVGHGIGALADDQPVQSRVRHHGAHAGGAGRARNRGRSASAFAQGLRCNDFRRRPHRPDSPRLALSIRDDHPADQCRPGAGWLRRRARRRDPARLRTRRPRTGRRRGIGDHPPPMAARRHVGGQSI